MSDIEWTDKTWNPVVGCSRVSAGCDHCYAMGVAHRKMSPQHVGLTKLRPKDASRPGIDWTGEVRFLPERLAEPLHWRKPRRVFVNSMSDLFHESLPFEQIAAVFGVMALCPQHTFQVLTKRPRRAFEFFDALATRAAVVADVPLGQESNETDICVDEAVAYLAHDHDYFGVGGRCIPWPLPNVHLGVSVEDQATADERLPILAGIPAAVRWISYEPALGPIDFTQPTYRQPGMEVLRETRRSMLEILEIGARAWVVVGGESGPRARPFDLAWARSVIGQCRDAGVAVFCKQLGSHPIVVPHDRLGTPLAMPGGDLWPPQPVSLRDRKGGDVAEWPPDLRVREWPRTPEAT